MKSMTGFVFDVMETEQGVLTSSLRSLNHRYLDIFIKLPETLKIFECKVRQLLQGQIKRGKVELILKFQPSEQVLHDLVINEAMLKTFSSIFSQAAASVPNLNIDGMRLLSWPGMLNEATVDMDLLERSVLKAVTVMLNKLIRARTQEGAALKQHIHTILSKMRHEWQLINNNIEDALTHQRTKLLSQLAQLEISVDQTRLEQETALLVQKADITEEVNRLAVYFNEVDTITESNGQVGRHLDFLMQELNREANTICSKSNNITITQAAIEIKVLIEQIREQVQNIE
jgi:uncharacterized protein (TIGR00255 family)